jgi:hypothetical protein
MKIKRLNTNDRIINQIQDNISDVVDHFGEQDLIYGERLENIALVTGSNNVPHKLSRKLLGWFVIRQRSAASIYDLQDSNPNPATFLRLQASANVTVDLFVF